jgi:hypothetical protein
MSVTHACEELRTDAEQSCLSRELAGAFVTMAQRDF